MSASVVPSVASSPLPQRAWQGQDSGASYALIIAITALLARAITFGNPVLHVDESFYFTVAGAMLDGAQPFVDIWDRKPVGLFLVYLLPALAGPVVGIYAYQVLALLSVVATALTIRHIARRAGYSRGALAASIAYVLWLNLAEGQGGQSPVFYNLPVALAALCIMRASEEGDGRRRLMPGACAMLLTGIALQMKYTVLFEGLFFGLWLLHQEWRRRTPVGAIAGKAVLLAFTALIPTIAAAVYFVAAGHWQDFYFANFQSILGRKSLPAAELAGNAAILTLILAPLLGLAFWPRREGKFDSFLRAWLASALAGLLMFGTWFDHYGLPVMVPAACCAAGFFDQRRTSLVLPLLVCVLVVGQVLLVQKRMERGTAEQVHRIASAIGSGDGCLLVYSGPTVLYPLTGRCRTSRYLFPSHLHRLREDGATGISQVSELQRILASEPDVIVVGNAYRGENVAVRQFLVAKLEENYRAGAAFPLGQDSLHIYLHK